MRWFFGLNCPLRSGRKGPKSKGAKAGFSSFGALGECTLFSLHAFSYDAHLNSPPSPTAPIFMLLRCLYCTAVPGVLAS